MLIIITVTHSLCTSLLCHRCHGYVAKTEDEADAVGATVSRRPTAKGHHKECLRRQEQLQHYPPGGSCAFIGGLTHLYSYAH